MFPLLTVLVVARPGALAGTDDRADVRHGRHPGRQPGARCRRRGGRADHGRRPAGRAEGPTGQILASDLSPGILEFTRSNARLAGFANVETVVKDGEALAEIEAALGEYGQDGRFEGPCEMLVASATRQLPGAGRP